MIPSFVDPHADEMEKFFGDGESNPSIGDAEEG